MLGGGVDAVGQFDGAGVGDHDVEAARLGADGGVEPVEVIQARDVPDDRMSPGPDLGGRLLQRRVRRGR